MNKIVFYAFSNQHSHPRSKLKYETHMRCLQLIRNKYEPKNAPMEKRVRSRAISESSESSDCENATKKKVKRSDDSMNGMRSDEDLQNVDLVPKNAGQLNSSASEAPIELAPAQASTSSSVKDSSTIGST